MREGISRYLPGANGKMLKAVACMFSNSPDTRFIMDLHPRHPQVSWGHAYECFLVEGSSLNIHVISAIRSYTRNAA